MDLVFPHHENEIAQSRALGHDFARIWMHNGMLSMGGEEMHKSAGNAVLLTEVLDRFGRETVLLFFMTGQWRKPLDFSEATLTAARAQAETLRNALRGETRSRGDWDAFAAALEDDFNTPAALAILHEWARTGALEELRRGLDVFGLGSLAERAQAPPEVVDARRGSHRGACLARLRRGRPAPRRDRGARLGSARRGRGLRARAARVTRDLVYGRNAVREALRGPREVLEVWASERAVSALDWLAEGPRPRVHKERELTEAAGTPDHQGVVAWCAPYAYADAWELAAVERPLICCLDQVTDPRNLGAVVRSAAGAGATGVVVPAHGATVVTAVVCRASAGAVEHLPVAVVPNLARYLADVKGDRLWAYAAAADGDARLWDVDLTDGVALVLGAEGKGVRPLVRRTCDATISIPLATGVESLNVSVAAAVALFEARRQRSSTYLDLYWRLSVPEPSLYLFDGSNLFHAGGFSDRDELVDLLSSFVAVRGARGIVVFDGVGADRSVGPLDVRFARDADTALERLAAERRGHEAVQLVTSDAAVRGTSGQEVRKRGSAAFLAELEAIVHREEKPSRLGDRVDDETRARLERLRRGQD